jgi:hypothetical protein
MQEGAVRDREVGVDHRDPVRTFHDHPDLADLALRLEVTTPLLTEGDEGGPFRLGRESTRPEDRDEASPFRRGELVGENLERGIVERVIDGRRLGFARVERTFPRIAAEDAEG